MLVRFTKNPPAATIDTVLCVRTDASISLTVFSPSPETASSPPPSAKSLRSSSPAIPNFA